MRRVPEKRKFKSRNRLACVFIVLSQLVISTSAVSEATSHRWLFVCKSKLIKITLKIQLEYLNQSISRNWRPLVNRAAIQRLHHCTKFYFKPHFPKQINSYNVLLITEHQKETNQISPAQMKQINLDFTGSSSLSGPRNKPEAGRVKSCSGWSPWLCHVPEIRDWPVT